MRYRTLKGYKYLLVDSVSVEIGSKFAGRTAENKYIILVNNCLLIKEGYAWDGPSGPTVDTQSFMRGSLAHDALYQLMREGSLAPSSREASDVVLRDVCLQDGMSKFRAWYVYKAVRYFARRSSLPRAHPRGAIIET